MAGKMVVSIINAEDAPKLVKALNQGGFGVTQISSSGGFLRQGNATLMTGVEEEQVQEVMDIIRSNTKPRARTGWWRRPGRHKTRAATIFVVNMKQAQLADA